MYEPVVARVLLKEDNLRNSFTLNVSFDGVRNIFTWLLDTLSVFLKLCELCFLICLLEAEQLCWFESFRLPTIDCDSCFGIFLEMGLF